MHYKRSFLYILLFFYSGVLLYAKEFVYLEITEMDSIYRTWTLETNKNNQILKVVDKVNTQIYCLDSNYVTYAWERFDSSGTTHVCGEQNKQSIMIHGKLCGDSIETAIKLGKIPWFQKHAFSLMPFVLSDHNKLIFQTFRFSNLKNFKLQAMKECLENIPVHSKEILCHKVKVSPPGWKARFYSVHLWFRKSDGQFVRFEGVNGPPGTPVTTIQLIKELSGATQDYTILGDISYGSKIKLKMKQ